MNSRPLFEGSGLPHPGALFELLEVNETYPSRTDPAAPWCCAGYPG